MKVRFCTSVGGASFSYLEGQTLDLPDPLPSRFLDWLRSGILEPVRSLEAEIALAPTEIERAVTRRVRRGRDRNKPRVVTEGD